MMPPEIDYSAILSEFIAGRVPAGVDPDGDQGRHFARWAAHIVAEVDAAPVMTDDQRALVVGLLRAHRLPEARHVA